jgi:hypothetical protein
MSSFASRLLLVLAIIGGQTAPLWAQEAPSPAALPAFVSQTGSAHYAEALNARTSAAQARQAAETLSAKFSDMATGSISSDESGPTTSTVLPAQSPQDSDGRSIVLAANHPEDPKSSSVIQSAAKPDAIAPAHRIPRRATAKASRPASTRSPDATSTLARVGQKVGFLDLLTNPALWQFKTQK